MSEEDGLGNINAKMKGESGNIRVGLMAKGGGDKIELRPAWEGLSW